jgi:hypothetical protein
LSLVNCFVLIYLFTGIGETLHDLTIVFNNVNRKLIVCVNIERRRVVYTRGPDPAKKIA